MSAQVIPAKMVLHVKMKSMDTHVTVLPVMKMCTVRRTQTSVPVTPVRMVPHVQTKWTGISVHVQQDMQVICLQSFQGFISAH